MNIWYIIVGLFVLAFALFVVFVLIGARSLSKHREDTDKMYSHRFL